MPLQMATGAHQQTASRVADVAREDGQLRAPLSGMFPKDLLVVSLAEALESVSRVLPPMHATCVMAKQAQRKGRQVQKSFPHMSVDECAAVVLYTMEDAGTQERGRRETRMGADGCI